MAADLTAVVMLVYFTALNIPQDIGPTMFFGYRMDLEEVRSAWYGPCDYIDGNLVTSYGAATIRCSSASPMPGGQDMGHTPRYRPDTYPLGFPSWL